MIDRMQAREQLCETIGYHDDEALDASIVTTILPQEPSKPHISFVGD